MSAEPSPTPRLRGPWAAAALAGACVLAVAVWWMARAAGERRLGEALAPWAGAPLPLPGDPVDSALAALGEDVFQARCTACHAITGEERLGPNLAGVTRRRDPAWITAMILRPDSMVEHDPVARELRVNYGVQMLVSGTMSPVHARAVLELLRRVDGGGA